MGRDLAAAVEAVRQMAGASRVTVGTIELAMLLLGYRKVAEPVPLPALPAPAVPFAEPLPPTTSVDEIMAHLAPRQ